MIISTKNIHINNRSLENLNNNTPPANLKSRKIPQNQVLDYLCNSRDNILGRLISFKSNNIEINSEIYYDNQYFPPDKIIPDGFKLLKISKRDHDIKGIISVPLEEEQITIIDREKDKDLQEIIEKYKNEVKKWKEDFDDVKDSKYFNWEDTLIQSTKYFINSYNRKDIGGYDFPADVRNMLLDEKFDGKETYLGEIIKEGVGCCRHKAFLFKLLLETQNIPVACKTGLYIDSENQGEPIVGHVWNTIKKDGKPVVIDTHFHNASLDCYLDSNFDYLYRNSEGLEYELNSLQPGKQIWVGIDKNGNFSKDIDLYSDESKPIRIEWDFDNKIKIWNDYPEDYKILPKDIQDDRYICSEKTTIKHKDKFINVDPEFIRANYIRLVFKAIHNSPNSDRSYYLEDYAARLSGYCPELSRNSFLTFLKSRAFEQDRSILGYTHNSVPYT